MSERAEPSEGAPASDTEASAPEHRTGDERPPSAPDVPKPHDDVPSTDAPRAAIEAPTSAPAGELVPSAELVPSLFDEATSPGSVPPMSGPTGASESTSSAPSEPAQTPSGAHPESSTKLDAPSEPVGASSKNTISLELFGRTDVGQVREHNEDNFLVADLSRASRTLNENDRLQTVGRMGTLLAVCDGMGGAAAGEVASQLAVDIVYQRMLEADEPSNRDALAARLVSAIETAGSRIFQEAKSDRSRRGMGTTSTVAALVDDHLFLGQVGDSRGYLLRGDRLVQVTRDQSLVNQLIEAGQLKEEEAETFEHNNIILQALGTAETVQVDLTYVELRRGDTLLLCSDGLSGMVRNDEIREVLLAHRNPVEACRELTDRANQAGGHDNVTVVIARFDGEGLSPLAESDVASLKYRKYELPEAYIEKSPVRTPRGMRSMGRPSRGAEPAGSPEIEIGYTEIDSDLLGEEGGDREDPVHLPRHDAPSWVVTMMIVSAVTCLVVAGYYLLGPR
jgi:serine/threonine protein phosphatase PrpC